MIQNCRFSPLGNAGKCLHGTDRCEVHDMRGEHPGIDEALHPFMLDMRAKLIENAHKGGWDKDPQHLLLARVYEEVAELTEALKPDTKAYESFLIAAHHLRVAASVLRVWGSGLTFTFDPKEVIAEAADVANMVMMIADNSRQAAQ